MKFIYLQPFLYCFVILSAFSQPQQVTFQVEGLNDRMMTVGYYFGNKRYAVDTLTNMGGKYVLTSDEPLQMGIYFLYSDNFYFEFVMDTKDFGISAVLGKGYEAVSITNSVENEVFKALRMRLEGLQRKQKMEVDKLNSADKTDSIEARRALAALDVKVSNLRDSIQAAHPDSFTAAFIGLMEEPQVPTFDSIADERERANRRYWYYRNHFLEGVDLSDPRLLRTPLLHDKVIRYFDEIIPQHPDTINQEIDRLFSEIGKDKELFRYWLVTLFQKYEPSRIMGMDAVTIHLIEKYYLSAMADWTTDEFRQKLREEVAFVKPNLLGNPAPVLNVVDTLSQPFYLEGVEFPFLVLFFYDPDCGHCKKATKKLKEEYDKLADLGAEVVAVCTVTDVDKWKKYIRENELPWIHVADPSGESRFRVTYNVRTTPKIYVLGPDRKIVAKQLEVEQLAEVIQRIQQQ